MPEDALIGKQLGPYLIQSKLGEGGMARVYKGYHARLRREVAIKVIASQVADEADFQARFEREAQVIASLEHPSIVAVYDFGEVAHFTYLVMQYVSGGTLRDQLRPGRPLDPRLASHYTQQMAHALHHAHQHGIVHRDVKPQNMLVSGSDPHHLLLSDFGIAKLFDSRQTEMWAPGTPGLQPHNSGLTSAGQIVGTVEYMAPEQIQGQAVDARTDVYALGVVLYQMLTGRAPFQADTATGLMYQHVYTIPTPVRAINPNVPDALAMITARALEKTPAARFQSAEAMAQALAAAFARPDTYTTIPYVSQAQPVPPEVDTYSLQAQQAQPASRSSSPAMPGPHTTSRIYTHAKNPVKPRPTAIHRAQVIATPILIALILGLIAWRMLPQLQNGQTPSTNTSSATAFTETFRDNARNWIVGTQNGLTADNPDGKYTLSSTDGNTHFPYPRSVGTLPANFTLTAQMMQTAGATNAIYGLAFHFTPNGTSVAASYAFVIDSSGNYALLEYQSGQLLTNVYQRSTSVLHKGLGEQNTLKVVARNDQFRFFINTGINTGYNPVQIDNQGNDTFTDATYHGGQLGLLVSGQNASYTVESVTLTLP